ncbi:carbohydrate-binding module family 32 protein [Karstenula rhodostoma CBS 690.94]|uniref:alpha,alpha-trehalase n=1 Tax=Karstenula rhodostoma CBS 690.94 TaxID=1392251 RepID=A0A9P4PKQ1_9PLEO|nr:carbohydrate-binding module family 32 protein [Karstenula rhodostoma CBS 690.94]
MRIRRLFLSALMPLAASTQIITTADSIQWNDTSWQIETIGLDQGRYQSRMSLANGYLGINLAALGPFFEADTPDVMQDNYNGWPLFNPRQTFATIAGFYDVDDRDGATNYPWLGQYGGDSFLSGIPHWAGLIVNVNGAILNASTDGREIDKFSTRLDMKSGILHWQFDWHPDHDTLINVEYKMFVHKLYVNQAAIELRLESNRDVNVTVYDVIDGTSAVRAEFVDKGYEEESRTIWSAVRPHNVTDVIAYVVSTLRWDRYFGKLNTQFEVNDQIFSSMNLASVGQSVHVELERNRNVFFRKYVGIASSDAFEDPKKTAMEASNLGAQAGFPELQFSHTAEWQSIMTHDSVDRYNYPNDTLPEDPHIRELQITSVTNPFMILQNTIGPNALAAAGYNPRLNIHSIPVCGLGSDCYGGLIFWDAETWMGLGLQLSHPQHIDNVVNYRVEMYPQAKENIKTAFASSKNQTGRFTGGCVFPWTSGRIGNCTASGPCFDYEYHVNGDIAIAFRNQYIVTGDAKQFKETFLPIANDIAYFYSELVDYNETSGYYELLNATDPDEYANNVDHVGFTSALIQRTLNETNELNRLFGLPQNETWNRISAQMRLPVHEEAGIVMEYASMNGSIVVKQADVVLIDDILNYENPYSLVDLDYYANKQSSDGPGMTYATFSIVANEISPSGCSSYTYHHLSSQPYIRAPWFQYSEQTVDSFILNGGTHPGFPFLTGMGGANRIGIFGYLGFRMFVDKLDIDPSLPPQIPHLNYRTFYWQGYGINATSNATHTTLVRLPERILDTANPAYASSIPVTLGTRPGSYTLKSDEELIVPNRMLGQTLTAAGNILQCRPVIANRFSRTLPGQFPIAAIDGASSTKWQPENPTRMSYMTVDTQATTFGPIAHILFDWGAQPPVYFEVLVSNHSIPTTETGFAVDALDDVHYVSQALVKVSEPWDPERATVIEPVKGNQTNVSLLGKDRVWSGRFVHLGISGNLGGGNRSAGGTVAEWSVILAEDGEDGEGGGDAEEGEDDDDDDASEGSSGGQYGEEDAKEKKLLAQLWQRIRQNVL